MTKKVNGPTTCRPAGMLLIAAQLILFCRVVAAQTQVLKWEIQATVGVVEDPDGIFSDVRVGDPVRASLSYDVNRAPYTSNAVTARYSFDPPLVVATMVIENPRSNEEIEFHQDSAGPWRHVIVVNDAVDPFTGEFDSVVSIQSVLPPPGFSGIDPVVSVWFNTTEAISNKSLPTQWNPNAWNFAFVSFYELDPITNALSTDSSYIHAEIYAMTPVMPPILMGDYNHNGVVDTADYVLWRDTLGQSGSGLAADGNGNNQVDSGDYDVWRAHFGRTSGSATTVGSSAGANAAVPEPASLLFVACVLGAALGMHHRRLFATARV